MTPDAEAPGKTAPKPAPEREAAPDAASDVVLEAAEKEEGKQPSRIEGGIDAVVIGASADGLTAAAYLGKAGLRTVLVEAAAKLGGAVRTREIMEGVNGIDGEHLVNILDPDMLADLELYRHGIEYAARRLDTTYFFDGAESLRLDGDLENAAALLPEDAEDEEDRDAFRTFLQQAMEAAAYLRPAFETATTPSGDGARARNLEKLLTQAPPDLAERAARYAMASVDDVLNGLFADGRLKTLLAAEAAFRSAAAPNEAFSFMHYIRRLAGETVGLQGAVAYPAGGAAAVIDALRRAAQTAKVDIRAATAARSVLIEGDRVAGVMLEGGGQLRASIVITALDARRSFLEMIGPGAVDLEFQRLLTAPRPKIASGRLHLLLKGVAKDDATRENMARRIVYAPSPDAVRRAFIDARAGRVPDDLIIEMVFPGAVDPAGAPEGGQLLSAIAHPLPFDETAGDKRRDAIQKSIVANLEKFAPGLEERITGADLRLPCDIAQTTGADASVYAAKPAVMQQWALAGAAAAAGRISGLYFCGPEAQIGTGLSCAAGRVAAKAALRDMRKGVT